MTAEREQHTHMSLGDHLDELRRRLILALLGIIPLVILGFAIGGTLLEFLLQPLIEALRASDQPIRLLATSPFETFLSYLKISLAFAIVCSFPWILYQLWRFVAPGLYAAEKRFVYFLIPLSAALTALGMLFLYTLLLPISLYYLILFSTAIVTDNPGAVPLPPNAAPSQVLVLPADPTKDDLDQLPVGAQWVNTRLNELRINMGNGRIGGLSLRAGGTIAQEYRVGEYTSIVFALAVGVAIAFQLPLVMMLLGWSGIIDPRFIARYRRHALFVCAILGAVFTPADPFSMVMLAIALYLLFEFGLILMRFVPASRVAKGLAHRPHDATDAQQNDDR